MSDLGLFSSNDPTTARKLGEAGRAALARAQRRLTCDEWIALLRTRLDLYRRALSDLSLPAISVGDLRHLDRQLATAGQFAGKEGREIEKLQAELRAEIAKAVPVAAPAPRSWA